MARKAGQGKEEEESRARQQKEKTPVRDEEKTPACDGRGHHVVEQGLLHEIESIPGTIKEAKDPGPEKAEILGNLPGHEDVTLLIKPPQASVTDLGEIKLLLTGKFPPGQSS
ncbi:hypothetical protein STEG23_026445 [Scotinomys teguina]